MFGTVRVPSRMFTSFLVYPDDGGCLAQGELLLGSESGEIWRPDGTTSPQAGQRSAAGPSCVSEVFMTTGRTDHERRPMPGVDHVPGGGSWGWRGCCGGRWFRSVDLRAKRPPPECRIGGVDGPGLNAGTRCADALGTSSDERPGGTTMDVRDRADTGEYGYTLVELLTIASIIAVLASIAIPMFISQRESAWRSAAASDARNAAVIVESVSQGGYPAAVAQQGRTLQILSAGPETAPSADDVTIPAGTTGNVLAESATSPGIRLEYHRESATRFCLCAYHDDLGEGAAAAYDSAAGGLVDACAIGVVDVCGGEVPILTYEGLGFASSGHWGPNPLSGGPDGGSSGSLVLSDVVTTFNADHPYHGGWSISYGAFGDDGTMTGYEVQFNRALGGFRVMPWVDGSQQPDGEVRHDAPESLDLRSNGFHLDSVRVDVRDGSLALWIDDEPVLSHDVSDVDGTFAYRDFQDTTVDYGNVSLTVE